MPPDDASKNTPFPPATGAFAAPLVASLPCLDRSLQKKKAVSLVEILVVVGILGLLAVLIIPSIGAVKARGETAKCASNLRSLGIAIQLYANDHDGRYPGPVWYSVTPEIWRLSGYAPITVHLAPYLGLPHWSEMGWNRYTVDVAICPTHRRLGSTHAHYARHASPANSPFGGEGSGDSPPLRVLTAPGVLGKKSSEIMALRDWPLPNPKTVHHGGQNILFLDGHVSWVKGRAEPL